MNEQQKARASAASKKYRLEHPEKVAAYMREYRKTHVAYLKEKARQVQRRLRKDILDHYGRMCACCGEEREEFLVIDHVNGGGNKHREGMHTDFYRWLRSNGYPKEFRVLCQNCNMALGLYGYCPHQPTEA